MDAVTANRGRRFGGRRYEQLEQIDIQLAGGGKSLVLRVEIWVEY